MSHIVSLLPSNDGNMDVLNSQFSVTPLRLFFYSHTLRTRGSKGDPKSHCALPEVTRLVEVYQLDPG